MQTFVAGIDHREQIQSDFILALDGHVQWRRFDDMTVRTTGAPSFWW